MEAAWSTFVWVWPNCMWLPSSLLVVVSVESLCVALVDLVILWGLWREKCVRKLTVVVPCVWFELWINLQTWCNWVFIVYLQLDMIQAYTPNFRSNGCYNFFKYLVFFRCMNLISCPSLWYDSIFRVFLSCCLFPLILMEMWLGVICLFLQIF